MEILRFDRDGTMLTAERRDGDGPPVVVVPGVMADAASWRPVVDALSLPNPVVVLNRRGRAPSGPLGDGYSLRTEIDDLHRVLDALGGDVELFGWSYGGLIALETAVQRRDLRSVVAYEPVSSPFGVHALEPLRAAEGDLDRAVEIVNRDVSGFSAEYVAALRESPVWPVLRPLAHPLAAELAALNAHEPAFDRYRDLDVPVTLLLGELNAGAEPYGTAFEAFERALPQARRVVLPGQGHLAHAQGPEVLAKHLAAAIRP
ncbi:alpha/beta fold hydrolase, partial [Amycolatopsis thermoflava]|uniref:alpha/beta fold hydrolase n=1 Tax=Amycolatopsis thermoflava TaxID=84480 RepID=UPI003EC080FA